MFAHFSAQRLVVRLQPIRLFQHSLTTARAALKVVTDERIPYSTVQLINAETGKLDPPTSLSSLLSQIDRRKQFVELITEKPSPLVKVIDKKERHQHIKALKKQQQKQSYQNVTKEIQLSWGVGRGDLEHKLGKARKELEKRHRVEIVFQPKKGQVLPSPPERVQMVDQATASLTDVAEEWKQRTDTHNTTVVYLRCPGQEERELEHHNNTMQETTQ